MKLSQLQPGQKGTISGFGSLSKDIRKKLMIMGLLPQTEVTIIRRAPMGDPIQVEVRDVSLAVRVNIAELISVEVG